MGMGMSVGSASTAQAIGGAAKWQQQRQNFNDLAQALSAGNLDSAKQAYGALSANAPKGVSNDPNSALSKLGQALQSGDVKAAQDAFTAMRSGGHHHHQHNAAASQPAAAPNTTANVGNIINTTA